MSGPALAVLDHYVGILADDARDAQAAELRQVRADVAELVTAARHAEEWMGQQPIKTEPHGRDGAKLPPSESVALAVLGRLRSAIARIGGAA